MSPATPPYCYEKMGKRKKNERATPANAKRAQKQRLAQHPLPTPTPTQHPLAINSHMYVPTTITTLQLFSSFAAHRTPLTSTLQVPTPITTPQLFSSFAAPRPHSHPHYKECRKEKINTKNHNNHTC